MHLTAAERAVGLARSWKDSGAVPQPAELREVIAGLRTLIHRLLPEVELHGVGLLAGSDEFEDRCRVVARARELAAMNVPADPAQAVKHAEELAVSAGLFQDLAGRAVAPARVFGDTGMAAVMTRADSP
ncbi:DUF6415 family natural product biosynthesis protein [Streptomyces sp. NPDC050428]|uniref:DUF6415 family natural product biosynthesis protein n=1 Tax=Streptomyces sp. NPDC050428 TaxID=3155757 RepID=UPI0034241FF9